MQPSATHVGKGRPAFNPAVVANDSDDSALLEAISHKHDSDNPAVTVNETATVDVRSEDIHKLFRDEHDELYVLVPKKELKKLKQHERVIRKEGENVFILDELGRKEWSSQPIVTGQFQNPGMSEVDHPVIRQFTMDDPAEAKEFNELLKKTQPAESPSILLEILDRQFYAGHFVILASYAQVWYRMPEPKA